MSRTSGVAFARPAVRVRDDDDFSFDVVAHDYRDFAFSDDHAAIGGSLVLDSETTNYLVRKEPVLRVPFDRKTRVILQALGRKAHGLSPGADRFNYRRRQESERDHMAYIAVA